LKAAGPGTVCHPGDIALLTRSQVSHWHGTEQIDVTHLYLSDEVVSRVAADVLERPIAAVRLHDLLRTQSPIVSGIIDEISREADGTGIGGALYVEALSTQLIVNLLRNFASVQFVDKAGRGELPPAVRRRIVDYIDARIDQPLALEELAEIACMGVWSFAKRFRASFQTTPQQLCGRPPARKGPAHAGSWPPAGQGDRLRMRLRGSGPADARDARTAGPDASLSAGRELSLVPAFRTSERAY
jgi:AraC-like DNA-binding protein